VVTGLIGERPAEAVRSLSIHADDRRKGSPTATRTCSMGYERMPTAITPHVCVI
jgi:hypothetical protein